MIHSRSIRAEASLIILLAVVLLGGGAWGLSKTKWFHGESKRAATSTKTTEELLAAQAAQGAAAAAYVQTMGDVVTTLPESREKDFLGRAGGIALSYLPKPDPQKVIEAQALKIAVLTGQLELANQLTASALHRAELADQRTVRAITAKQKSDLALEQAAAEARGAEQQAFWLACIAAAAGVLYLWTKLSHVSPLSLSAAVRDLREGTTEPNAAIAAIDANVTPFQQANVALNHWLRRKASKIFS